MKNIAEKELAGENINDEDCRLIKEFISGNSVVRAGRKTMTWGSSRNQTQEKIAGVKLMAYIYNLKKEERIMVVGPIYDYRESFE